MRHSGFTLYEMLLTLTLVAILVGLGQCKRDVGQLTRINIVEMMMRVRR